LWVVHSLGRRRIKSKLNFIQKLFLFFQQPWQADLISSGETKQYFEQIVLFVFYLPAFNDKPAG